MGRLEWAAALALAAATFAVHDVARILGQSYWLDEQWVAVSTRAPLAEVPSLTASSPLGWTLLLRLVPGDGDQRHRLLPLVLLAAACLVAYAIGRRAPLPPLAGGCLAATALLLSPHALVRNDLKQYTSDAFCCLLLLLLVLRAEERPSRHRLAVLVVAAPSLMLLSSVSAFGSAAAFLALALSAVLRRSSGRRLLEIVVAGVAAALGLGVVYLLAVAPNLNAALTGYWDGWFLPLDRGPGGAVTYVVGRLTELQPLTNLGPWWLSVLLVAAGCLGLARRGHVAAALCLPVLAVLLVLASAARRYPLLEQRTSFFLFAMVAVLAAIGAVTLAHAFARLGTSELGRFFGVALLVSATVAYVLVAVSSYARRVAIPHEDLASATAWAESERRADDVVVVTNGAQFGYAYYARSWQPTFVPTESLAMGFVVASDPERRRLVVAPSDATSPTIASAVRRARELAPRGARIFVVDAHFKQGDVAAVRRFRPVREVDWPGTRVSVLGGGAA